MINREIPIHKLAHKFDSSTFDPKNVCVINSWKTLEKMIKMVHAGFKVVYKNWKHSREHQQMSKYVVVVITHTEYY